MVVLCLVLNVPAQDTVSTVDRARQIAATTNDNATALQQRQEALKNLEEAAQLFLSAGETVEAARVLNRVGRLHLILNSPQNAIATHNQALSILKETAPAEVEVDNLNSLAEAYLVQKEKSQVEPALNRAITLSEQAGYKGGKAQAFLTLSKLQNDDDHVVALKTAQEALALWKTVDNKKGIARSYEQLGECYMAQNMLPEATESHEQALQLSRDMGDSQGQASALINLGYIDIRKAEWQSSISRFIQAQALIDEKADPKKMGQIACGMAEVYMFNGLPEVGHVHYERALNYYRQTQNSDDVWYVTWGLGASFYFQQKYPEALHYLKESMNYLENEGSKKAMSREYIGRVFLEMGNYPAALEVFQFVLDIYTKSGNPMEMGRVEALMGSVFERQGQLARARANYLKALELSKRVSDPIKEATFYHALGRVELKSGKLDEAEDYLLHSIAITEKLQGISTSRDLRTAFYGSVHDRYQTYIECLMAKARTSASGGYDVRAFEMSESARARSLAEFFRTTHASAPGIDPQLAEKERSLRQSLTQKTEKRSLMLGNKETSGRTEELSIINADVSRLETEYNEVLATINNRYPAYAKITQPVSWTLRRIQEEVIENDQTMLLEYSLGRDKSYAWTVTRNGMKVFELPGQEAITSAARKLSDVLKLPPLGDSENKLTQASQELSQMSSPPSQRNSTSR
jgi:tetratricopeptide (TPR) repeat protein